MSRFLINRTSPWSTDALLYACKRTSVAIQTQPQCKATDSYICIYIVDFWTKSKEKSIGKAKTNCRLFGRVMFAHVVLLVAGAPRLFVYYE